MDYEQKTLLLKDLSARLPYRLMFQSYHNECGIEDRGTFDFEIGDDATLSQLKHLCETDNNKPYLRPMSSMTESEIDKLFDILHIDKDGDDEDWIKINDVVGIKFFFPTGKWVENVAEAYDYLNSIHIDYRGLIPMGLALEAPANMYKTE